MEIQEVRDGCIRDMGQQRERCGTMEMAVLDKHDGIDGL